jgi:hypothetical protein
MQPALPSMRRGSGYTITEDTTLANLALIAELLRQIKFNQLMKKSVISAVQLVERGRPRPLIVGAVHAQQLAATGGNRG